MASAVDDPDDRIFDNLRKPVEPKVLEEQAKKAAAQEHRQYEQAQQRLAELIGNNSTLPCTISSIRVLNANNTRKGFLQRVFDPILSSNQDRPYTLAEAIREVSIGADKLHAFDIFHQPISLFLERPSKTDPSSTPTDFDFYLTVKEKSRIVLKTGTDVGNAEGSAYGNLLWRNVFGGAETLNLNASLGTRTRSAYQANFETPILSNPNVRLDLSGLSSSTSKAWASHEEVLNGGAMKLRWATGRGSRHEVSYNGTWRQITSLASNASPTVRASAGDCVKSSMNHTWTNDQRDNPLLPSRGYYTKSIFELAGWGPLRGDVSFWKTELETQAAVHVPIPGVSGDSGVAFTAGLRGGLLHPLSLGGRSEPQSSRLNDRFQLGGPTDVRGFRLSGLGPRDGTDAVGGDIYAAGSANLFCPLPRLGKDAPLRLQAFVNGGRLLALPQPGESEKAGGGGSLDGNAVQKNIYKGLRELGNGLPSMAAGIGLVYAHPVARFELNFLMPIVVRKGEEGRKGLQFGVGINLL
ncbi:hypothetical protein MMC25_004428 [Agyrium rufum]|nr:hypothetical protein [Agyrium rufum]